MSYTLEELKPLAPFETINDKKIIFSLVNLNHEVYFAERFGGIQKFFHGLKNNPETLLEVSWLLLSGKEEFKSCFKTFETFLHSGKELTNEWAQKLVSLIEQSAIRSRPIIKNLKRVQEMQKIKAAQNAEDGTPCYAKHYDSIASRYGYTIDQYYELTLRQLQILLKTANEEEYQELEFQAALNGRELKAPIKVLEISDEEDNDLDKEAQSMFDRLKKNYEEKKNGK